MVYIQCFVSVVKCWPQSDKFFFVNQLQPCWREFTTQNFMTMGSNYNKKNIFLYPLKLLKDAIELLFAAIIIIV